MKTETIASAVTAGLALAIALGSGYWIIAELPTVPEVEHLIELKSTDKFSEILRRLDTIDRRLDRLEHKE